MNKMCRSILWLSVVLTAAYLTISTFIGANYAVGISEKIEMMKRMEAAKSVHEACNIARPFIGLLVNTVQTAKIMFGLSCALALVNLFVFAFILGKKESPPSSSEAGGRMRSVARSLW